MRSGRHEEFRNGPEVKIYIWEVIIRSPEIFGGIPVLYRDHRRGSGGPPGGATGPGGIHGPSVRRDQPLGGLGRLPTKAHAPREKRGQTLRANGP